MDLAEAERIASDYRKALRNMRKLGLKVEDMPPSVAEAALRLHQHALMVEKIKRERRSS